MRSDRDETGTDRTVTRRSVAIPVRARGELAVVEMKGDDAVEHALVGKSVGQAPSRVVAREVHARGMKVARVDEQTQPLGRRSHVAEKARQLADGLAQLASLAGVLDVQAGPREASAPRARLACAWRAEAQPPGSDGPWHSRCESTPRRARSPQRP